MKALVRIVALTLLILPVTMTAQGLQPQNQHPLAGYWEGDVTEAGSEQPARLVIELRIQGDVVNGPVFMLGGEQYIRPGGTVTANTVMFTTPRLSLNDRGVPLAWSGQLSADNQLAFSVVPEDGQEPAREFILTKQAR